MSVRLMIVDLSAYCTLKMADSVWFRRLVWCGPYDYLVDSLVDQLNLSMPLKCSNMTFILLKVERFMHPPQNALM